MKYILVTNIELKTHSPCDMQYRHPPLSILVLSGRHHIMSYASIANNCIIYNIVYSRFATLNDKINSVIFILLIPN